MRITKTAQKPSKNNSSGFHNTNTSNENHEDSAKPQQKQVERLGCLDSVPKRWIDGRVKGRQAVFHRQSLLQVVRQSGLLFRQNDVVLNGLVEQGSVKFPDAAMALQLLEELVTCCQQWMEESERLMESMDDAEKEVGRCGLLWVCCFWEYHVMKIRPLRDGNRRFAAVLRQACADALMTVPMKGVDGLVFQTVLESGRVEDLFNLYVEQMREMEPLAMVLQTIFVKSVEEWVKCGGERSVWESTAMGDVLVGGGAGWRRIKWR